MSRARFLYVSYFLPPLGRAESRHNVAWLRELIQHGFEAEVMTAHPRQSYQQDKSLTKYLLGNGVPIHRILVRPEGSPLARFVRYKLGFIDLVSVKGWEEYLEYALRLHREEPFDFVYSVYGLPLCHQIALEFKKRTGLPWVAEFRDPIVHNIILRKLLEEKCPSFWRARQLSKMRAFEGSVVQGADFVVVEAPLHDQQLVEEYIVPEARVKPFGVGYDSKQFAPKITVVRRPGKVRLGYVGSLYEGFVPMIELLVEGLVLLQNKGFDFEFIVVGDDRKVFHDVAKRKGLNRLVDKGRVPQDQALLEMQNLDAGLVMLNPGYKLINSKFWEYLYAGCSLLALADDDGAMAKWIRQHEAGYVLPYSGPGIAAVLGEVIRHVEADVAKVCDRSVIQEYDAPNMTAKIAERIDNLLSSGSVT